MRRYDSLLLDLWRLAAQPSDIDAILRTAYERARAELPIASLTLVGLDLERRRLEVLAEARSTRSRRRAQAPWSLDEAALTRLLTFVRRRSLQLVEHEALSARLGWPAPGGGAERWVVGPLVSEARPLGILYVGLAPEATLEAPAHRALETMLEPFAVALASAQKQRELAALREALEAENRSLLSRLGRTEIADTIVGAETGLKPVIERVELVAAAEAPVLILGETGSGKEVVARAVHKGSRRHAGPFLRVNCGAIPPELVDSELFGHERGSFTGAERLRRGWFERADGGTLFLDEVAELPVAAQVRLLRILQDGTFQRVGGEESLRVDVRIVAATHRDLPSLVQDGRFRADLWYRIAVFPIHLPPLRERTEDIAQLAAHFALRAAKRLGSPPLIPTPADVARLVDYGWPGNIRELAAVMERAVILGNGASLEVGKALGIWQAPQPTPPSAVAAPEPAPLGSLSLAAAEKRHIEAALARCHGRVHGPFGAAKLLEINPHTLRGRMRKLAIDPRHFRSP